MTVDTCPKMTSILFSRKPENSSRNPENASRNPENASRKRFG